MREKWLADCRRQDEIFIALSSKLYLAGVEGFDEPGPGAKEVLRLEKLPSRLPVFRVGMQAGLQIAPFFNRSHLVNCRRMPQELVFKAEIVQISRAWKLSSDSQKWQGNTLNKNTCRNLMASGARVGNLSSRLSRSCRSGNFIYCTERDCIDFLSYNCRLKLPILAISWPINITLRSLISPDEV